MKSYETTITDIRDKQWLKLPTINWVISRPNRLRATATDGAAIARRLRVRTGIQGESEIIGSNSKYLLLNIYCEILIFV